MKTKGVRKATLIVGVARLDLGRPAHEIIQKHNGAQSQVSHVAEMYLKNPRSYRGRLNALIRKAIEEGVNLLLLPASTLVWQNASQLRTYRRDTERITWVVGGLLNIPLEKRVNEKPLKTVAWFQGQRPNFIEPDTTHWLLCGKGFAVVAIQSKAKRESARVPKRMKSENQISQPRVMVLLMKPRHFAPRPFKSIINAVWNQRCHPQINAVIQLFSYSGKSGKFNRSNSKQLNNEIQYRRHEISNEKDGVTDCLDLFRFKDLRVELPN